MYRIEIDDKGLIVRETVKTMEEFSAVLIKHVENGGFTNQRKTPWFIGGVKPDIIFRYSDKVKHSLELKC